jgi:hypothetical protein
MHSSSHESGNICDMQSLSLIDSSNNDGSSMIIIPHQQRTQTMHTTIDQGLSVSITITNENLPSMNNKNYRLILIPIIEHASKMNIADDNRSTPSTTLIDNQRSNQSNDGEFISNIRFLLLLL